MSLTHILYSLYLFASLYLRLSRQLPLHIGPGTRREPPRLCVSDMYAIQADVFGEGVFLD